MGRVTLENIARMAGVSKSTVSRILNEKKAGYSRETEQKVRKLLEDTGYIHGGDLFQMPYPVRSKSIGLVLPDITNPFFQIIADAVEDYASQQEYSMLLGGTRHLVEKESLILNAFIAKRVDGIIFVSVAMENKATFRNLERYKIPCVLLDRKFTGMEAFGAGVFIDSVYPIYRACEHLIQHNSRRLVFIAGPKGVSTAQERFDGYRVALKQHDIELSEELICYGDYTIRSGYDCMAKILRSGTKFDAVIAANDFMAIGALSAIREAGLRVPEEIEVIGFDGIDIGEYITPPLSTIAQPAYEMGRKSAELLFKMINGKRIEQPFVRMEAQLILRGTTR